MVATTTTCFNILKTLYESEKKTAVISLNTINRVVSVMETDLYSVW
jgi:hypothetical protein